MYGNFDCNNNEQDKVSRELPVNEDVILIDKCLRRGETHLLFMVSAWFYSFCLTSIQVVRGIVHDIMYHS